VSIGRDSATSGSSFHRQQEVGLPAIGGRRPNHVGSDFPHKEGCGRTATNTCGSRSPASDVEVRAMVGGNAARVYGFDLNALARSAARSVINRRRGQPLGLGEIPDERAALSSIRARPRGGPIFEEGDDMGRVRYGARTPKS